MILTIPNILTVVRLALIPVILYFIHVERYFAAAGLIFFAALSDMADGYIARHYNQKTTFGSNFDPIVDKALLVLTYVMLAGKGIVPLWFAIIVISRDLIIFFVIFFVRGDEIFRKASRDTAVRTTMHGKMTTVTQIITILYGLTIGSDTTFIVICVIAAAVSVITGVDYGFREFRRRG